MSRGYHEHIVPLAEAFDAMLRVASDQENHSTIHFLKSRLIISRIVGGIIAESRPPSIMRDSGEVRKVRTPFAMSSPAPAATRVVSRILKSLPEMPWIIL